MNVATATTAPTRGRPRDPRRREAILRAAMTLIGEVGYERATVEAIAHRAGVSKPTIYRRWPNGKEDIVIEALRAKRAAGSALPDTGNLRGDLLAMLDAVVLTIDPHLAGGLISHLRASEEFAKLFRAEVVADERRRYDVLLDRALARGEIDAKPTRLFADVAGSVIFGRVLIAGEPVDRDFLEELVDHVLLPIVNPKPPKDAE
ncbi:MAG TPA: TetR/AcrR family transcriptional regulator [Solirubrobacter sp.]|nr:TetR/AcrR family transcriptional regulator [Solirubrobacter sp.]